MTSAWAQMIVAGTMLFAIVDVSLRTRDDEPIERAGAILATISVCCIVTAVLTAGGFWGPMIR